jgi:hypothetical protein
MTLAGVALLVSSCASNIEKRPWFDTQGRLHEGTVRVDESLLCKSPLPRPPPPESGGKGCPECAKDIQSFVRAHYRTFRVCYEEALARDAKAQGRVTTRFTIELSGEVRGGCIDEASLRDGELVECVLEGFRDLRFPPPRERTTVEYPIMFSPG